MTAMPPQTGRQQGGRRYSRDNSRDSGGGSDRGDSGIANLRSDLSVAFERLDQTDDLLQTMSQQMSKTVEQLNTQSGAIQVLSINDANLRAQLDSHAAELREWRDWRLQFMTQFGAMQASLESKIQAAVTTGLKESQTVERRSDDGRFTDARNVQQWLVTALIAVVVAVLTYLFTHPIR